ncbi:MAG: hypothetical protein ACXABY_13330 [Candidatus Thorarchaeota archaeon]|jgi:hypothetical protein
MIKNELNDIYTVAQLRELLEGLDDDTPLVNCDRDEVGFTMAAGVDEDGGALVLIFSQELGIQAQVLIEETDLHLH